MKLKMEQDRVCKVFGVSYAAKQQNEFTKGYFSNDSIDYFAQLLQANLLHKSFLHFNPRQVRTDCAPQHGNQFPGLFIFHISAFYYGYKLLSTKIESNLVVTCSFNNHPAVITICRIFSYGKKKVATIYCTALI